MHQLTNLWTILEGLSKALVNVLSFISINYQRRGAITVKSPSVQRPRQKYKKKCRPCTLPQKAALRETCRPLATSTAIRDKLGRQGKAGRGVQGGEGGGGCESRPQQHAQSITTSRHGRADAATTITHGCRPAQTTLIEAQLIYCHSALV